MLRVTTTTVGLDLPSPVEAFSRLVCQDDGPLVLAALESGAARGPWVVADVLTGRTRVGRNLAPVTDGGLGADGPVRRPRSSGCRRARCSGVSATRRRPT